MSFRPWRWLALAGCVALVVLVVTTDEASARRRGGSSSPFVMTPYGPVAKSAVYGGNMSPAALAKQQASEQSYMKKMSGSANKKSGSSDSKKKSASDSKKKKN